MLQPLSNSFLAEVLGISPRHLCLLSLPRGGLFPCVLYNLGHEVTSIQALSVETPEAWLVHLPLQSSFVVALPRSLGLAQPGATAMPISLGSLLPPNPPQSEGRPLTRFSGDVQAFSYLKFMWPETSFLVLSVTRQIFLPAARLLGVPPPHPQTSGFLGRTQLRPPSSCLLVSYLPAAGFHLSVSACESVSHSVMSDSLRPHGLESTRNSPGKNPGVDCHSLLQGIFLTWGLNLNLAGGFFSISTTREVQPVDYQKPQKAESKPVTYGKAKPLSQQRAAKSQEDSFLQLDSAGH